MSAIAEFPQVHTHSAVTFAARPVRAPKRRQYFVTYVQASGALTAMVSFVVYMRVVLIIFHDSSGAEQARTVYGRTVYCKVVKYQTGANMRTKQNGTNM